MLSNGFVGVASLDSGSGWCDLQPVINTMWDTWHCCVEVSLSLQTPPPPSVSLQVLAVHRQALWCS